MSIKRVTYSLHPDRAGELAQTSLDLKVELKKTVNRQDILDELVILLVTDKAVRAKVTKALKKL